MNISSEEQGIIRRAIRYREYDSFTEYYFQLPFSGTWFTPEDNVRHYGALYKIWKGKGEPDEKFIADLDEKTVEITVMWDGYYDGYPIFLLRHGFRMLPWIKPFIDPRVNKAVATTGTGSGKTCNIGVFALMCCALFPGFRFLNVAPTQTQADLMLGEIEKWAGNSQFNKFIKKTRGAHELWIERPYPTITIISPVDPRFPSTFVCQTSGQDATNILGGERDYINVDEAQLMFNITSAEDILVTRMRGTRSTGVPRWTKLTWITNPGANAELVDLIERYDKLNQDGDTSILVLRDIDSSANIYVTKRQLDEQRKVMSQRRQDRWLGGQMSAVYDDAEFSEEVLDRCRDRAMETVLEAGAGYYHDELGLIKYELPYEKNHDYIIAADVGKSPLVTFTSQNVPSIMVFDVTNFMEDPIRLVALDWIDGENSYAPFVNRMRYFLMKYRCRGYYDATNIQSAFEDIGGFEDIPFTQPVFFSGQASVKKHAIAITSLLMQAGLFRWPYIKGLWYQARVFNPSSRKIADDLIACLLVFARVLSIEGTLWTRFTEYFSWDEELGAVRQNEDTDPQLEEIERIPVAFDRHARILAG